ncbi:MAG: SDR family oxidoreductase [Bacteroidia bacterium]
MYDKPFHTESLKSKSILITGGAGFIGSNIAEYLMKYSVKKVRVLDNLSNGFEKNIKPYLSHPNFEFVNGDITNFEMCKKVCEDIDIITHQAALGSVPRSIKDPIATHNANATGFIHMLTAAKDAGVERFIYASSSSVYGDSKESPKHEKNLGTPLSPYAVSKLTNELYGNIFASTYNMRVIGLRYFNVFGPKQDPNGPYAAAIPLFMDGLLNNKTAYINGDGSTTRDFTFVENAVQINVKAMCTENADAFGKVYNVAVGESTSLNELFGYLQEISGNRTPPQYRDERPGDIKHSLADISLARNLLDYNPQVKTHEGLAVTYEWFSKTFKDPLTPEGKIVK